MPSSIYGETYSEFIEVDVAMTSLRFIPSRVIRWRIRRERNWRFRNELCRRTAGEKLIWDCCTSRRWMTVGVGIAGASESRSHEGRRSICNQMFMWCIAGSCWLSSWTLRSALRRQFARRFFRWSDSALNRWREVQRSGTIRHTQRRRNLLRKANIFDETISHICS